jgi:hypothetical protein
VSCAKCGHEGAYADALAVLAEVSEQSTPAGYVYAAQVELHELLKRKP